VERLKTVKSIETAAVQMLLALTVAGGAVELVPFIRFISGYLDMEWAAINEQNKGIRSSSLSSRIADRSCQVCLTETFPYCFADFFFHSLRERSGDCGYLGSSDGSGPADMGL
jgi:hypothetical protein